ncbi:MAG: hypothetical protein ACYTF0_09415 [Planctomycetota bacterium]|jgi:hypothetical protein
MDPAQAVGWIVLKGFIIPAVVVGVVTLLAARRWREEPARAALLTAVMVALAIAGGLTAHGSFALRWSPLMLPAGLAVVVPMLVVIGVVSPGRLVVPLSLVAATVLQWWTYPWMAAKGGWGWLWYAISVLLLLPAALAARGLADAPRRSGWLVLGYLGLTAMAVALLNNSVGAEGMSVVIAVVVAAGLGSRIGGRHLFSHGGTAVMFLAAALLLINARMRLALYDSNVTVETLYWVGPVLVLAAPAPLAWQRRPRLAMAAAVVVAVLGVALMAVAYADPFTAAEEAPSALYDYGSFGS